MSLKPCLEIAVHHEDMLKGTFQQAEFAADVSRVHAGTATAEDQNAALFFQRTFNRHYRQRRRALQAGQK